MVDRRISSAILPPFMRNFFRARREELGLTQRAIALKLNLTTTAVSEWESGNNIPKVQLWDRLATVYKVSVSTISKAVLQIVRESDRATVSQT